MTVALRRGCGAVGLLVPGASSWRLALSGARLIVKEIGSVDLIVSRGRPFVKEIGSSWISLFREVV